MDYPQGHGLRRIHPNNVDLSPQDEAAYTAAQAASEPLFDQYADDGELPPELEQRKQELEAEMERLDALREAFGAEDMARAGVLVCLSPDGSVRVDRGLVRADDGEPEEGGDADATASREGAEPGATPSLPDSLVRAKTFTAASLRESSTT